MQFKEVIQKIINDNILYEAVVSGYTSIFEVNSTTNAVDNVKNQMNPDPIVIPTEEPVINDSLVIDQSVVNDEIPSGQTNVNDEIPSDINTKFNEQFGGK